MHGSRPQPCKGTVTQQQGPSRWVWDASVNQGAQEHRAPQLAELPCTDVSEVPQEATTPTPLKKSTKADPRSQPTAHCWISVESHTSAVQHSEPHRTLLMSPKCQNASATRERGCHRASLCPNFLLQSVPDMRSHFRITQDVKYVHWNALWSLVSSFYRKDWL